MDQSGTNSGTGTTIDAVIVLGAQVQSPGVPGPAVRRRVSHGVRIFEERGARHLLLSGGGADENTKECVLMSHLARAEGVPEDRIVTEGRSRNTFENALYCGEIVRSRGWRSIVVVTDGFHLMRALYAFRRLGTEAEGAGVPRPDGVSRRYWYWSYADEGVRFARSAFLFAIGTHKPVVEALRRG